MKQERSLAAIQICLKDLLHITSPEMPGKAMQCMFPAATHNDARLQLSFKAASACAHA